MIIRWPCHSNTDYKALGDVEQVGMYLRIPGLERWTPLNSKGKHHSQNFWKRRTFRTLSSLPAKVSPFHSLLGKWSAVPFIVQKLRGKIMNSTLEINACLLGDYKFQTTLGQFSFQPATVSPGVDWKTEAACPSLPSAPGSEASQMHERSALQSASQFKWHKQCFQCKMTTRVNAVNTLPSWFPDEVSSGQEGTIAPCPGRSRNRGEGASWGYHLVESRAPHLCPSNTDYKVVVVSWTPPPPPEADRSQSPQGGEGGRWRAQACSQHGQPKDGAERLCLFPVRAAMLAGGVQPPGGPPLPHSHQGARLSLPAVAPSHLILTHHDISQVIKLKKI